MRVTELRTLSYPALWAERVRLEQALRDLRHTLDCVGHAIQAEEYTDLRHDEANIEGDLRLVTDEVAGRLVQEGAR
jgi:hypothetical protein